MEYTKEYFERKKRISRIKSAIIEAISVFGEPYYQDIVIAMQEVQSTFIHEWANSENDNEQEK